MKGTWYVLENKSKLLSSLILYDFGSEQFGIGSIATPQLLRKQGHASRLISAVIFEIENKHQRPTLFLYSDIEPEFYENLGFQRLPADVQRYKATTCMIRGSAIQKFLSDKRATPEYF